MKLPFGAVQSGFGGIEPPRLPEMLPILDARGPVKEGAFENGVKAARLPGWTIKDECFFFLLLRARCFVFFFEGSEAGAFRLWRQASPSYVRRRAQQLAALQ